MFEELKFSTYYEVIASELRAALSRYYDAWLDLLCKDDAQKQFYLSTIEQKRIAVVILTCSLLEHTINFYLCTKCEAAEFRKLERESFLEKWTKKPKKFAHSYEIHPNSGLRQQLRQIVNRRISIVHAKPMLSIDGDNRHHGNVPPIQLDETALIESCATLPFRLVENLLSFDPDAYFAMNSVQTTCGTLMRGLNGAKHRFDYAKRLPEELINEIASQGYSRERSRLFAALIGPVPSRWLDRSVPVHRYKETITVLRPLKFFESTGFILDPTDPALRNLQQNQQFKTQGSNNQ